MESRSSEKNCRITACATAASRKQQAASRTQQAARSKQRQQKKGEKKKMEGKRKRACRTGADVPNGLGTRCDAQSQQSGAAWERGTKGYGCVHGYGCVQANKQTTKQATKQASKQPSKQASKQTKKQKSNETEDKEANKQASKQASKETWSGDFMRWYLTPNSAIGAMSSLSTDASSADSSCRCQTHACICMHTCKWVHACTDAEQDGKRKGGKCQKKRKKKRQCVSGERVSGC